MLSDYLSNHEHHHFWQVMLFKSLSILLSQQPLHSHLTTIPVPHHHHTTYPSPATPCLVAPSFYLQQAAVMHVKPISNTITMGVNGRILRCALQPKCKTGFFLRRCSAHKLITIQVHASFLILFKKNNIINAGMIIFRV